MVSVPFTKFTITTKNHDNANFGLWPTLLKSFNISVKFVKNKKISLFKPAGQLILKNIWYCMTGATQVYSTHV